MCVMKHLVIPAAIAAILGLSGCQTPQGVAANAAAAHEWMHAQQSPARIQVSGTWFSEDWGRAELRQNGRTITGRLDTYEVQGVASGNKAYLTTWDSGKCYYALILTQPSHNVLMGSYTDGPRYRDDPGEQRVSEFRRSH
jgi:hypothetical protein